MGLKKLSDYFFCSNTANDCLVCAMKASLVFCQLGPMPFTFVCHHTTARATAKFGTDYVKTILSLFLTSIMVFYIINLTYVLFNTSGIIEFWYTMMELLIFCVTTYINIVIKLLPHLRINQLNEFLHIIENRKKFGMDVILEKTIIRRISIIFTLLWITIMIFALVLQFVLLLLTEFDGKSFLRNIATIFLYYNGISQHAAFTHIFICYILVFKNSLTQIKSNLLVNLIRKNINSDIINRHKETLRNETIYNALSLTQRLRLQKRFYMALYYSYKRTYCLDSIPIISCFVLICISVVNIYLIIIDFRGIIESYINILEFMKYITLSVGMWFIFYIVQSLQNIVSRNTVLFNSLRINLIIYFIYERKKY